MNFKFIAKTILVIALAACSLAQETQYMLVMIDGQKCGYAVNTRLEEDKKIITTDEVFMSINRLGITLDVREKARYSETKDGKPLSFETEQLFGNAAVQKTKGVIEGNNLLVTRAGESSKQIPYSSNALMPEGVRLYMLGKGLKLGTKLELTIFDGSLLASLPTTIEVFEKEKIDLFGRVKNLYKVITTTDLAGAGKIKMTSFVDDDLNAFKTATTMMGMNIEMIACEKEVALKIDAPADIFSNLLLKSPVKIPSDALKKPILYNLKFKNKTDNINLPKSDNQTASFDEDGYLNLRVSPALSRSNEKMPLNLEDKDLKEYLSSNNYVQSDNQKIIALAKEAVGGAEDALTAVRNIESFVNDYINNKNLSIGYATAVEVMQSKEGDCTEHAVLTAALCRAVGIPAKIVCGVVYAQAFANAGDIFGGHAWNECFVGGKWIGIDSTIGKNGYGSGHIMLAAGDGTPEAFFSLINLLGNFEIVSIEY